MDLPGPIHDFLFSLSGISSYIRGSGSGITSQSNLFCLFLGIGSCLYILILYSIELPFCSAAQLLIYVGAINVLIIFAVMFLNGSEYYKDFHPWTLGDGVTSGGLYKSFASLITTIPDTSWYGIIWTTKSNQIIEQDLINNSQEIGIHLSTDFFIPFELISIILLVALIGAIAVARQ